MDIATERRPDPAAPHHVVVDVLFQSFPKLQRQLVERFVSGQQVVGANDGGVAANIA